MYWITGTLGVVFLMAPFLLGYSNSVIAATTSLIVGFAITFLSLLEGVLRERGWEDVVISIFGMLAIVAPFALGYSTHMPATVTDIITGSVTMIIGYSMYARLKNI